MRARPPAPLEVGPADVPVEGYYAQDERLTEYFRLMRTLQQLPDRRRGDVDALPASSASSR